VLYLLDFLPPCGPGASEKSKTKEGAHE